MKNRYPIIFKAFPLPGLLLLPDAPHFTILDVNTAYLRITGKKEEDLVGKSMFEGLPGNPGNLRARNAKDLGASLKKVLKTLQPHKITVACYNNTIPNSGDPEVQCIENIPILDDEGNVVLIIHTAMDITEKILQHGKEQQLKKEGLVIEDELKITGAALNKIMNSSLDVICAVDAKGRFLYVSAACEKIWGYAADELIGKHLTDFVSPEDHEKTNKTGNNVMRGNDISNFENRYIHKNGSLVPMSWSARWDPKDQIRYGVARDVTEKKKLEKALEAGWQQFYDLFLKAPFSMGILKGPAHVFEMANPLYFQLIGKKDIIGKTVKEVLPEVADQGFIELLDEVYQTGDTFSTNEMLIKLDKNGNGQLVDIYLNFTYQAYRNNEDKIEGIFFFAIDVTEGVLSRKQRLLSAKQIEESEKRYRQIVETAQEGIWMIDKNNRTTFVNTKLCEILEYTSAEMMGKQKSFFMDKEDRETGVGEKITRAAEMKEKIHISLLTRSGRKVWVALSGSIITDQDGQYNGALSMVTDITEQKKSEEEKLVALKRLKQSEEKYRSLIERVSDAFIALDTNWYYTYVNKKAGEIVNRNPEEMIGQLLWSEFPETSTSSFHKAARKAMAEQKYIYLEEYSRVFDRWFETHFYPSHDGLSIFFKDITRKKETEEGIRLQAELLNTIGQAVVTTDLHGIIGFWNKAAEEIYGWAAAEVVGKNVVDIIPTQQTKEQAIEIMKELSQGHSWTGEFIVQGKDGQIFPIFATDTPIYDAHHKLSGIIAVSTNIAIQKQAEAQINNSEQRYRTLFEQNLAGFYQSTAKGVLLKCNDAFVKMLKYDSQKELLEINTTGLYFSNAERKDFISNVIEQKKLNNYEGVLKCKDGSPLYFLENISLGKDPLTGEEFFDGILIDISKRKETELLLKESNQRFNYVAKATFDAIWDWDLLTQTIYWGEGFHTLFGYDLQEINPDISSWTDHIHPEDIERVVKGIYELIEGEQMNWIEEYRYLKTDQTYAYVTDKGFLIRDEQGKAIRMVGAMQDITARKELENLLDKASNLAGIGSWEVDLIKNTVYWSNITKEIHEVKHDFVPDLQTGINFYKEGASRDLIAQKVGDAIEKGIAYDVELQVITAKGNEKWIRAIGEPAFENGRCVRINGSLQDIDAPKRAKLAVAEALNERNTILESIGDGFFAVDKNWTVTYWNNQAENMLRISKMETLGRHLWAIFPDSINTKSYRKYHQAIETSQVVHFEDYYPVLTKWYEISAYPSDNGLSVYFQDITERKNSEIRSTQLNKNLEKHAKELAASNEELEQFAYVASHDLQEPLRMVTSFLTQLEKKYGDVLDENGKKYIGFAVDGAKRMRQIILDLLEFSRVGKTGDNLENIDLNDLVDEIQILFRKQIEEKKAVIIIDKLPKVNAHRSPMRQVFQNLVSNALKYTRADIPAKIHITTKELKSHWQFSVADNGIGIEEEYFDKIFLIFQRLHNKEDFAGTGLGLAVTKKIIENLGGKIWLESKEGKGSTFYFTLLKAKPII